MELNWIGIFVLTFVFTVFGAIWFGPVFGKLWMKIHGMESKSKKEMEASMDGMWKLIAWEAISVFVTIMVLDFALRIIPGYSGVHIGFIMWLGFVLPTYITATLWGNDARKWMFAKIALTASYRLVLLLVSGYVLSVWR